MATQGVSEPLTPRNMTTMIANQTAVTHGFEDLERMSLIWSKQIPSEHRMFVVISHELWGIA
eukprot:432986-Rhodomonas_salina.3